jgi:hypothetical protein
MAMPNLLSRGLHIFNSFLTKKNSKILSIPASLLIGHAAYSYGTQQEIRVVIEKKYDITTEGYTNFMVKANNREFSIPYSLWYWQYNVPEKFNKLDEGKEYNIKYYGFRCPPIGLFPNIVGIEEVINEDVNKT